jgi:hypothetical protein
VEEGTNEHVCENLLHSCGSDDYPVARQVPKLFDIAKDTNWKSERNKSKRLNKQNVCRENYKKRSSSTCKYSEK